MLQTPEASRQLQLPEIAPMRPRPSCSKCAKPGPTIDGRCSDHLTVQTEGWLYCISPADLGLPGK